MKSIGVWIRPRSRGLACEGIYVAPRLGRMRISPHDFNDEQDADRLIAALVRRLKG
jgi:selenocysteine lyase/cysteine desulfurase